MVRSSLNHSLPSGRPSQIGTSQNCVAITPKCECLKGESSDELTRLIHADGRFASYSSLKRESFPVVAREESKQPVDKLRRRRFTQRVTHVPRQGIEFVRC